MKRVLAVIAVLCLMSGVSFAKKAVTVSEKTGIGFGGQINGADTISLRYWKGTYGLEALLGYYSYDASTDGTILGGKYLKPLKKERNLTCYWFGMLAIVNGNLAGVSASGNLMGVGLGVEFFFQGIPNLGFGAEIGVVNTGGDAYKGGNEGNALFGNSMNNAGLRYYFD